MRLGWLVNAYYSHSIHNAEEVGPQSTKGSFPRMQGSWFLKCKGLVPGMQCDGFARELSGIMEVAVWPCGFAYHYYLGFGSTTQLCYVSSRQ